MEIELNIFRYLISTTKAEYRKKSIYLSHNYKVKIETEYIILPPLKVLK